MITDKYADILKSISLFQGIESSDLDKLLECLKGKVKEYLKNETIILAGEEMASLGIILNGSVQIIKEDIMGNRVIVADLPRGEIFGETFVCAGVKESPVSVIAMEVTQILWISVDSIITSCTGACNFHNIMISNLMKLLARKNLYLNQKLELLSKRTMKEKIMAYLTAQAEQQDSSYFDIHLNRNELADYLCIDRSALSRELSRLREEGLIDFQKNHFKIIKSM